MERGVPAVSFLFTLLQHSKKRWDAIYIPLRGERDATHPLHRSLNSPWVLALANFEKKVGIKMAGGWVCVCV